MWNIEDAHRLISKIRQVVQFLKHSTADRIAAFVMLTAATGAAWLGNASRPVPLAFVDEAHWQSISRIGSLLLYGLFIATAAWIGVRIWRRLTPPPPITVSFQPTAIKGPMAFGPHDAELFRRFGREADGATLLTGWRSRARPPLPVHPRAGGEHPFVEDIVSFT